LVERERERRERLSVAVGDKKEKVYIQIIALTRLHTCIGIPTYIYKDR